ncbi:tRNA pseudouridine(13) synthase [Malassezia yamatoensis]|uniref:tRNA pseudouridine(13) synthase n=1 Tax=Malassezia yamatoensis TaxID=253288 RepID=A0AAJ5YTI4_9BASI|nr:tRNA pseudouridine(13) synthase [Malassezia yamatoensis]
MQNEDSLHRAKRARVDEPVTTGVERDRISEKDVGMTQYVHTNWSPVHGIIKQRYSDFLVHEVDPDGNVVHIVSLAPPEPERKPEASVDDCAETWDSLQPWFGDQLDALKAMAEDKTAPPITSSALPDKADRTRVHQLIRRLGDGKLSSEAATIDDVSAICVKRMQASASSQKQRDPTNEANRSPPYIHFVLQKTNRDNQEALQWLARFLRLDRHRGKELLSVAGTKDKRAVTVQRVALKRGKKTLDEVWRQINHIGQPIFGGSGPKDRRTIQVATNTRAERGLRVAHLSYATEPLQLGMLSGNQFTVTLRNVCWANVKGLDDASDRSELECSLKDRVKLIEQNGFINYFGMQRFGTGSVSTHAIGIAILRGDFSEALRLLFSFEEQNEGQNDETAPPHVISTRAGMEAYTEKRYTDAYNLFPKSCVAERAVLDKMRMSHWHPSDSLNAFQNIPRTLRLMYVHAYQSYLWNSLVSERVRRFGALHCVPGDSILENSGMEGNTQVRFLGGDAENHDISSVVMPMPGSDVQLQQDGWMADLYSKLLAQDGLTPSMLYTANQPEYRLKGSYRHIIQKPSRVHCELIPYNDFDAALCETDEEKLLPETSLPPRAPSSAPFLAFQMVFQLPASSYATILLRELLRMDTSAHTQKSLTKKSSDQTTPSNHTAVELR